MPVTTARRLRLTAMVTAPLLIGGVLALTSRADDAASTGTLNPPASLYLLGSEQITSEQVTSIAQTYRVVALNPWEGGIRDRIKAVNPRVTVLVYKDLSSTRDSESRTPGTNGVFPQTPTGVSYFSAPEAWFAHDATTGKRLRWGAYPDCFQMQTWNPAYRKAWVGNVTAEVAGTAWDGVLADNANHSKGYVPDADLDEKLIEQGTLSLVQEAGAALRAHGKLLIPNVESARVKPDSWWTTQSAFGGANEEQFAHFSGGSFLHDYPGQGIRRQGWELASVPAGGIPLVHTTTTDPSLPGRAADDDDRVFSYAYSNFLIWGGGRGAFSLSGRDTYTYAQRLLRPEQTWQVGSPKTPAPSTDVVPDGRPDVIAREFDNVFTAANISQSTPGVTQVPLGLWIDGAGRLSLGGSVTLEPFDGLLLKRLLPISLPILPLG